MDEQSSSLSLSPVAGSVPDQNLGRGSIQSRRNQRGDLSLRISPSHANKPSNLKPPPPNLRPLQRKNTIQHKHTRLSSLQEEPEPPRETDIKISQETSRLGEQAGFDPQPPFAKQTNYAPTFAGKKGGLIEKVLHRIPSKAQTSITSSNMAANRKYAGLPDLDPAPEIYETPELTDDASTVQTNTLRTESPSPSVDGKQNEHFDKARLNQEEARRRFEPAIVSAKNANMSDTVGGSRRGYKTAHRRRKRRVQRDGLEEYGDISDMETDDEEESLIKKLTRLQREAEEIKMELARREREGEEAEFKDSLEHQQYTESNEDSKQLLNGVEELNQVLGALKISSEPLRTATIEQEFIRQLKHGNTDPASVQQNNSERMDLSKSILSPSSISAITAFSDRLSAIETSLGLSAIAPNTSTLSILPTLDTLTAHVTSLYSVVDPKPTATNAQRDYLETLTNRLHALHAEADKMLNTRKAALQALHQLHEARYSGNHNSAVFAKYLSRREARERQRDSIDTGNDDGRQQQHQYRGKSNERTRTKSGDKTSASGGEIDTPAMEDRVFTDVFLEEQSSKISALYNTLPTIQDLQPLLPLVLERLRGLNVVHASASSAHRDMEDVESRLKQWENEMAKWRQAIEGVEQGIEDSKDAMKDNVQVIGALVKGVEDRMAGLEKK